ncbi:MAG TPA: transcription antitermination factor NusB, partial [Gemmatimonadales bacterium]|nr:transcription antitermination factor NusB [Gemmatimonadales bacterium]
MDVAGRDTGLAPRRAAWRVLQAVRAGVPFEVALSDALAPLDGADRRLAHELAAGTMRSAGVLDLAIAPHVTRGYEKVEPALRELLRLGAYQLTGLDRIPAHAAVSTTVALARESPHRRAAPFVNAVLRRVAEQAPRVVPGRASHPGWLVTRWTRHFGSAETARLLAWNDTRPRLVIQPARWDIDRIGEAWRQAGIAFEPAPLGAGLIPGQSRPQELPGFAEGGFIVQDAAQALVVRFFAVPEGRAVYDACAAPGGKSIALGRSARVVVAADRNLGRVRRLRENLARAGSGREHPCVADAAAPPVAGVDAAILDAPCLGTGVLARHPDARWRVRPEAIARLVAQGAALLRGVAPTVRPGGLLCFSTCSLEPEENEMQIETFLASHPEFRRESGPAPEGTLSPAGDLTILPHRHGMDGA